MLLVQMNFVEEYAHVIKLIIILHIFYWGISCKRNDLPQELFELDILGDGSLLLPRMENKTTRSTHLKYLIQKVLEWIGHFFFIKLQYIFNKKDM